MGQINKGFIEDYFESSAKVISSLKTEISNVTLMASEIYQNNLNGGKVLIAGNGGSSADAEHFAGELLCTFKERNRRSLAAISLSNNPAAITAWANDFEFESFFSRQVNALGRKNDILFLISTGGGNRDNGASMNLVYAAEEAKNKGMKIFTISGKGGGILKNMSDICIVIDSNETSTIQEAHITLLHSVCFCIEDLDK